MEKEFVPYELALRMKALDYNEPCFNLYHLNRRELMYVCPNIGEVATYKYDNHNKTNHISAPTFSQTFRWFREKYDLYYTIGDIYGDFTKWSFAIGQKDKGIVSPFRENDIYFDTYEESEFACLIKLIEIVEKELIN